MNTFTRPTHGQTYWAPCANSCKVAPLISGEFHGVIVDGPSQSVGVVYSTQEKCEAAFNDPDIWNPKRAQGFTIREVVAVSSSRFRFAD